MRMLEIYLSDSHGKGFVSFVSIPAGGHSLGERIDCAMIRLWKGEYRLSIVFREAPAPAAPSQRPVKPDVVEVPLGGIDELVAEAREARTAATNRGREDLPKHLDTLAALIAVNTADNYPARAAALMRLYQVAPDLYERLLFESRDNQSEPTPDPDKETTP